MHVPKFRGSHLRKSVTKDCLRYRLQILKMLLSTELNKEVFRMHFPPIFATKLQSSCLPDIVSLTRFS